MGIQTITGVVLSSNDPDPVPWENAIVEVAFTDGYVPLSPLNVVGRADANGAFTLKVYNNAVGVEGAILRLPDDSLFGFDLDPNDTTVDLGNLVASGVAGSPRLLAAPDGIKRWVAVSQQSGTDIPSFTIQENTIGVIVPTRDFAGSYVCTGPTGCFPENRTKLIVTSLMEARSASGEFLTDNALRYKTTRVNSGSTELFDDVTVMIEIEVWPAA